MSLEESMKTLADSNLELAAAMREYAGVMKSIASGSPTQIAAPAATTAAAEPAKATRGRKPAADKAAAVAEPEPEAEVDPFADEPEEAAAEPELTADVIRGLVMKVKDKNKEHAIALLKKVGAETVSKIDPKDYQTVVDLAKKVGVTL